MAIDKEYQDQETVKKLDQKMVDPFKIKVLVELLCQLNLPTSKRIRDVFYSNLLQKTSKDPLSGQRNNLAPLITFNKKNKKSTIYQTLEKGEEVERSSFVSNRKNTTKIRRGTN